MEKKIDWQEVVKRKPRGYMQWNDLETCLHGPIESVTIDDDDMVVIKLKWGVRVRLGEFGIPQGAWEPVDVSQPLAFPNLLVPFVEEETPEKGPRVRFGASLLYFNFAGEEDQQKFLGLNNYRSQGGS